MCGHKSSMARYSPFSLKTAIILPFTVNASPEPSGIAPTLATLTNSRSSIVQTQADSQTWFFCTIVWALTGGAQGPCALPFALQFALKSCDTGGGAV